MLEEVTMGQVEDVHFGKRTSAMDPGKIGSDKEQDYWKKQAEQARARREYMEETRDIARLNEPPQAPEPPFKVTGEVSLVKFDLQEEQRAARETAERDRKESNARIETLTREKDEAEKKTLELRMAVMQTQIEEKMSLLAQAMAGGSTSKIDERIAEIELLASKLGFVKAEAGPAEHTDLQTRLAVLRVEAEIKREDRQFQRLMKKDEREWQIELKRLEAQSEEARNKLAAERERSSMIANMPAVLGSAFAKGLMDRPEGESMSVSDQAAPRTKNYKIEAGQGEAGEIDCQGCGSPIGIGETARTAECVKCHSRYSISRVSVPSE